MKFYVVWTGRKTGIFKSWNECKDSVHGFAGAKYKSFSSLELAEKAFSECVPDYGKSSVPTKKDLSSGEYEIPDHAVFINEGSVVIYTDGSLIQGCVNDMEGNIGGYGAWLVHKNGEKSVADAYRNTTISRMELMAVIESLKLLNKPVKAYIYSDSSYVVNTINQKWKRKKNKDLWKELDSLINIHDCVFYWVSGHNGLKGNEKADKLATDASGHVRDNQLHDWKVDVGCVQGKSQKI